MSSKVTGSPTWMSNAAFACSRGVIRSWKAPSWAKMRRESAWKFSHGNWNGPRPETRPGARVRARKFVASLEPIAADQAADRDVALYILKRVEEQSRRDRDLVVDAGGRLARALDAAHLPDRLAAADQSTRQPKCDRVCLVLQQHFRPARPRKYSFRTSEEALQVVGTDERKLPSRIWGDCASVAS